MQVRVVAKQIGVRAICDNDCMTTPTQQRVVVVDDVGVLAIMSPEVATKLLASGQCVRTDRPDVFNYTPKGRTAMRKLSPAEKRALVLKAAKR